MSWTHRVNLSKPVSFLFQMKDLVPHQVWRHALMKVKLCYMKASADNTLLLPLSSWSLLSFLSSMYLKIMTIRNCSLFFCVFLGGEIFFSLSKRVQKKKNCSVVQRTASWKIINKIIQSKLQTKSFYKKLSPNKKLH